MVIYNPLPKYMLALKCNSARIDYSFDVEDGKFLVKKLGLKTEGEVYKIYYSYFPKDEEIPLKLKYFISLITKNGG